MDNLTRKVISRYRDDPDEMAPDFNRSWMEYVEDKNVGSKKVPGTAVDLLQHGKFTESPGVQANPYDYEDPSSKPKDQKDGPPFVSNIPPSNDYGLFQLPTIFKDHGELEEWLQSTEQDMTQVEEDQNPAISVTRKYAGVERVVHEYIASLFPIVIAETDFDSLFMTSKVAATLDEVVGKDYHYKNDLKMDRATAVSATWINQSNPKQREAGLFIFRVSSPGSKDGAHMVYLQFLRGEAEKQYPSYAEYPVTMACTCPSFLYHGAQFYAVRDKYMYMPAFRPDLVSPKPQNVYVVHSSPTYPNGKRDPGRGLNFRVCKHLLKVYEHLKTMRIETHYRRYPVTAPPSKDMNAKVWKDLMKFDFTEANIKQRLKSARPKIPAYFNRENLTKNVIDWFNGVWIPRKENEKIKALRDLVEYPERIFFILMKEAYLKKSRGEQISDSLINEGYDLMSKVVQPENKEIPQKIDDSSVPGAGQGTGGISPPGGDTPAGEFIKGVTPGAQPVSPAIKKPSMKHPEAPFSREKQREIAKKLRGVKREE